MKNYKSCIAKPLGGSRPWVMWTWNLSITNQEVETQLNGLISAGFGGIAVRPGRDMCPGYMSDEFLEHFGRVLEIARQHKVGVRLADDFSLLWGGCAENITMQGRASQAVYLVLDRELGHTESEVALDSDGEYILQAVKREPKSGALIEVRQINAQAGKTTVKWKAGGADWSLLVYRKVAARDPAGRLVPNIYNAKAAQTYIQNTLEVIKARFIKFIPTTFEGIITEVPALRPGGNAIFWDDGLNAKYRSRYKCDLLGMLPYIFLNIPGSEKHRTQIHNLIYNSLAERFASQLETWTTRSRLSQWVLWPETVIYRPENAIADGFVPETSFATLGLHNNDGSLSNYALLRTVADINATYRRRDTVTVIGRNRNMFGSSLQNLKREIDLSLLAGPSRVLFDGFYFNMDQRNYYKTPFNPSWYSPDWEHLKLLCGYSARSQELISGLQASREIAVLCPTDFIMGGYIPGHPQAAAAGLERFQKTIGALCCFGKEFDILTEELLLTSVIEQTGEFAPAKHIRKGNYRALVVPYAPFVSRRLLVFLEKLASKGATIIFIDEAPKGTCDESIGSAAGVTARIGKLISPKWENVVVIPPSDLDHTLSLIKQEVTLLRESGESAEVAAQVYLGDNNRWGRVTLLHNLSETTEQAVIAEVYADRFYTVIDCTTGKMTEIEPIDIEGHVARMRLCFTPLQTILIISTPSKLAPAEKPSVYEFDPFTLPLRAYRIVFKDQWIFEPKTLNALPLSNWSVRMGLSRESGQISHFYETTFEVKSPFDLDYCIFVLNGLNNAGIPFQNSELMFNGVRIDNELVSENDDPLVRDNPLVKAMGKDIQMFDLKKKLAKGLNRVSIRTTGSAISPQTLAYPPMIIGDFAVAKGPHGWSLDKPVEPIVGHESWVKHGYPYLSGRARYEQTFEVPNEYDKLILRFSKTSGTVYVKVNEIEAGVLHWHPMELDITDLCNAQRNDLSVEVVNTMDNVTRLSGRPSGLTGEVYVDVYKA